MKISDLKTNDLKTIDLKTKDTIVNVSRRDFLKKAGISGGGLVLGIAIPTASAFASGKGQAWMESTTTDKTLNVFIQINPDNIIKIIAHRSEMGQGIRTGLPQVVADELEADWERVQVIQGLGDKKYGSQNTDGSRSMRKFYHIMREAGASVRLMLTQAAAKTWKVPVSECIAVNQQVKHTASGKTLDYGKLASIAATLPVPDKTKLTLKKSKDFKYIGKPVPIVDLDIMLNGEAEYGIDTQLPDMLYASIERCPVIGGSLVSVDDTEARKIKGVIDIITLPNKGLPPVFHASPGIAVIANNSWTAMQARKKLNIKWDLGANASHTSKDYLAALSKSVATKGTVVRSRGDVDKAFADYSEQHEATYTVPYLAHATMEPPAASAIYHGDGHYEIWACTQDPQGVQSTIAGELKTEAAKVKVHVTLLGGAFGRKSKPDFAVEAAFLAKTLNKPVKVTWSREDDIHFDYFHAISAQYYKAAWDKKGKVKGWVQRAAYPSIGATFNPLATSPQDFELSLGFADMPFDFENISCEKQPALAHLRIGWLRSVDNIHQAFAIQSFINELALKTGKDAKEFLLESIGADRYVDPTKEGFKYGNYGEPLDKYPIDTARLKNVIQVVGEKSGYGEKIENGEGWGIAGHRSFLTYVAVATKVKLENNKVVLKEIHCAVDCGLAVNPDRVRSQMEGAMIFGASIALMSEITTKDGRVEQSNYNDYQLLRMYQSPKIVIHLVATDHLPTGVGEPGVPPVAPSITNAIVAAGGKRIRDLPVNKHYKV